MSAGGIYLKQESADLTTVRVTPEPFSIGELDTGARATATSVMTIPIPAGSNVVDMQVTFRDRRPAYDNDSRTVPTVTANKLELETTISGWVATDMTFAGRVWRRHERVFPVLTTSYTYRIYVAFDVNNMYLMFQGIHANQSNLYGGWENLTVNFSSVEETSSIEEIEVDVLVDRYIPTFSESVSDFLNTGIDMRSPVTHVVVGFIDFKGYREIVINPNGSPRERTGLATSDRGGNQGLYSIIAEVPSQGVLKNESNFLASANLFRIVSVDVFSRKKVKVIK